MNYSYYEFQSSLSLKSQISHINEKVHIMYEIVTVTSFFSTIQFSFHSTQKLEITHNSLKHQLVMHPLSNWGVYVHVSEGLISVRTDQVSM